MQEDLLQIFKEEISEQARAQGRQYSLPVAMYLSVIAILMGAKNPMDISRWMNANGKRKEIKNCWVLSLSDCLKSQDCIAF